MDYPCICGRRFTTERWMKIHRTKMGCLKASPNQQQRTAQAGKTSENQSQVQNHSAEEIHAEESDEESRQVINAKGQKINFPTSKRKEQWEALDSKIVLQLDKLIGKRTLEHKLITFADYIYLTCLNIFGAKQHQATREPKKSRGQREMETLRKRKNQHCAEQNPQERDEVKRKRTRNASTKTHFS